MSKALPIEDAEAVVHLIRGQRVMLDSDLAGFYGVTTKRLLEQVRRNIHRFPEDFAFRIRPQELANLRSQFATSSLHGGRRTLPWVQKTTCGEIGFHTLREDETGADPARSPRRKVTYRPKRRARTKGDLS